MITQVSSHVHATPQDINDLSATCTTLQGTLIADRGELSRTLPTPFFLRLDTYQKNFEPNYLQAEFIFGKSE